MEQKNGTGEPGIYYSYFDRDPAVDPYFFIGKAKAFAGCGV
jgi:hypothetical protein